MPKTQLIRIAAVVVIAAAGLFWMNTLAPLRAPSVLAYCGLGMGVAGVIALLIPLSWSGLHRRLDGFLYGLAAGFLLLAAAWFWPISPQSVATVTSRLDYFLPTYDFQERHQIIIQAPPDRVRQAFDQLTFADLGVVQTLGRIRGLFIHTAAPAGDRQPPRIPMVEAMKDPRSGFFPLDDAPAEFVFGIAGQPWRNGTVRLTPEEFLTWSVPGNIRVAANFRIENLGDGRSRLSTETRVSANDPAARRRMAHYWAFIYPGSGMIRRSMLEAVRARAEAR